MGAQASVADPQTYVPTLDELQHFVVRLTPEMLKLTVEKDVAMFQATLETKDSIFIPPGWYCIEKSTAQHPMIYAGRPSYMTCGQVDVAKYLSFTTIHAKSGRGVGRMRQIYEKMRDAEAQ